MLLDDLHRASPPSLQLLAFLAAQVGSAALLVAATYRDVRAEMSEELEATLATVVREPATQQLGLAGSHPAAVAQLTEILIGRPPSDDEVRLLHQRTDGNPFFVTQFSRLLGDTTEHEAGSGAIPTAVRRAIGRRLSQLLADVRDMLDVAAVLGGQLDLRRPVATTGLDAEAALKAAGVATTHGLLEILPDRGVNTYRFVHALVRETIYGSLPSDRAAKLHGQVVEGLERLPHVEAAELAKHFWHAADLVDDDRPVRHLATAADQALAGRRSVKCRRARVRLARRGGWVARVDVARSVWPRWVRCMPGPC